ncbi:HD-GYP domain-containing protein [Neobacillus jeddahensis]|uniref:HD-GYP domain-containing protein n=1 Tax=Neobacillus jeddahensis TaxID=1461580 RepID=UPI00058EFBA2|nr:HD-GYP domain-containing protein [Neobacillus jeddahensis]
MFKLFNKWLKHPNYFRYSFYIMLISSILLNSFVFENESNFYILYIFCAIFLGIGFFDKPWWLIVVFTLLVVCCRYYLIPELSHNIGTFFTYFFTYLVITLISVGLMKFVQRVKEDNLALIMALSKALDSRDAYTQHHSKNVAKYSVEIANRMMLSRDVCDVIHVGGLLHDIGKIGIPGTILKKPEKLTDDEYNTVKTHPTIGYEIIKHVESFQDNGILDIVLYHHERYDGKGYPTGLKGMQIPLVARIVAVADTFDAMSSQRVYRDKLDLDVILKEIERNKGKQFDPEIVDVFLDIFDGQAAK